MCDGMNGKDNMDDKNAFSCYGTTVIILAHILIQYAQFPYIATVGDQCFVVAIPRTIHPPTSGYL